MVVVDDLPDQLSEVEGFGRLDRAPDAAQLEQVVDRPPHPFRGIFDTLREAAHPVLPPRLEIQTKMTKETLDGHDR